MVLTNYVQIWHCKNPFKKSNKHYISINLPEWFLFADNEKKG